jgi:transcription antitermination factor NusB
MRKRTRARGLALETLYRIDLMGADSLDETLTEMVEEADDPEVSDFASELVRGTIEHRDEIDRRISRAAKNWDISRMTAIDRSILRLGIHELCHRDDIPPKVSINEAIDLGKQYSTADSGAFINGILDNINQNADVPGTTDSTDAAPDSASDGRTP